MEKEQALITTISAPELRQEGGYFLVDVRTAMEFEEKHIPGAELHPLHELDPGRLREKAEKRPVCLICRTGSRAGQAANKLAEVGLEPVVVLENGLEAWESAGFPLRRGRKGVSLERQVRIAAGTLVLVGVGGALLIHPAFLGLSAFVGAGLVFAGITDWCGMGLLLARMPWNQKRSAACCHSPGE